MDRDEVQMDAVASAQRAVTATLVARGFAADAIAVRGAEGPNGLHVVTAAAAGAYPGTGIAAAIVDGAKVYGPERGLAEIARDRGWLATPPDAETMARVASVLLYDGLLALDEAERPRLSQAGGGLVLECVRRLFPSGARERVRIEIPPVGDERLSRAEADAADAGPIPIDRATALVRALDAGDLAAAVAAVAAIDAPKSPREHAALARAATSANDTLAADALLKLGATDAAAAALHDALATVDAGRRSQVTALLSELWGAAFAERAQ